MQIEQIDVGDLIPYINNSRTHSDEQVMQVASSMKEFGFTNPILIDGEGGIIAGGAVSGRGHAADQVRGLLRCFERVGCVA